MNREALVSFAHTLADTAGAAIRPYFGDHGDVDAKGDSSPVTRADREAESAIRALIEQHYPNHGIYGEEHGAKLAQAKYCWVIDPIDGTRAFITGKKEWGTLIALCEDGVPILGVLDQPITGERWIGATGQASTYSVMERSPATKHSTCSEKTLKMDCFASARNDAPIQTRPCPSLSAASISTTSRNYFTPPQAAAFVKLAGQCGEVIEDGDCYAYGLLARGLRDVVVDAGLKPYDILALVPIIEGAGGKITNWDGAAVRLSHYANVVASGDKSLHSKAITLLQGA